MRNLHKGGIAALSLITLTVIPLFAEPTYVLTRGTSEPTAAQDRQL
jgi:hypothetical protein